MRKQRHILTRILAAAVLAAGTTVVVADGRHDDDNFCMDVELGPFHMVPGFMTDDGACAVRDYWEGKLQDAFYPFTIEDHLFNCEVAGDTMPLSCADGAPEVPTSVQSQGEITGTIGGHPFSATLFCASLTNWYQQFCVDPCDPDAACFQLAQPFLSKGLPFPRVTEVSLFDGIITVDKGHNKTADVPILIATRAAGITHLEDPPELVGASVTHSLLGLLTYELDDGGEIEDVKNLGGSLDVLLQGHIFAPVTVEEDDGAAVIKGAICSKKLHKLLHRQGKRKGKQDDEGEDD